MKEERNKRKKFHLYYIPLLLSVLVIPQSVILHSISKPDVNIIKVTEGNFERFKTDFSWYFFERGIFYGDKSITPFKRFLWDTFYEPPSKISRYFDLSNPTPFMLLIFLLVLTAIIYKYEKK